MWTDTPIATCACEDAGIKSRTSKKRKLVADRNFRIETPPWANS
jgi:hypothetical protein